jgi:NDP-sugar pyrophosphorylase family protein
MTTALIMAGGRSQRMRDSFGPTHKALIPISGRTLLEWNVRAILAAGVREIIVAVSAAEPEVRDHALSFDRDISTSHGATLECVVETQPLGNIGIAGQFGSRTDTLLVVYADNLTTLDLGALVAHHRQRSAAMTVATHFEPFQIPFGEVIVECGRIADYREKSTRRIYVASGAYVLTAAAMRCIPRGRRMDIAELFRNLQRVGQPVASFHHDALWIDVNDASAVERAGNLVEAHRAAFERLASAPIRVADSELAATEPTPDVSNLDTATWTGAPWQCEECGS